MGALHAGHLSLVKLAQKDCDVVVSSIFINPTQFNDSSDLENYPSNIEEDILLLEEQSCDILFVPNVQEMYPQGPVTKEYLLNGIDKVLEGQKRPGHFDGVCTIVHRLFSIVKPNIGYFGEKDFQQLFLIKKMVKDFNLGVKIIGIPTVRDSNGLALSSRNKLLNDRGLEIAKQIYLNIKKIRNLDYKYTKDMELYLKKELKKSGLNNIEYIEIRETNSLKHPSGLISPAGDIHS